MPVENGAPASTATALPTIEEIAAQMEAKSKTPDGAPEVRVTEVAEKPIAGSNDPNPEPTEEVVAEESDADKAAKEALDKQEKKRDPQAARFAALARREKEARQRLQDAEARAKAVEDKERTVSERETRLSAAKKHPLDLLKEHGYSYADATQAMLGNYKPAEPDPIQTKLDERLSPLANDVEELKKAKAEISAALDELKRHRMEVATREVQQEIVKTAKEGGYEFISNVGDEAYALVQDVISEFYKKHKRILNYSEACDRVEKYYEDRFETLAKSSKVQSRFAPATQKSTAPSTQSPVKPAKESPKTLTQSLSTTSARAKIDVDKLDRNEALAHLATTLRYID